MLTIGLTGGIACGKSTVCHLFRELGITVIDADQLARDLVEPGTKALQQITAHFGDKVLTAAGQLDRKRLREIIFGNPAEKYWLEQLLHPQIRTEMQRQALHATSPYVILDIPLLLETESNPIIDRILVIDVPEALQIQRAMARDNITATAVKKIMQTQVSRPQRLASADDVIENHGDLDELRRQVLRLHETYLALAAKS